MSIKTGLHNQNVIIDFTLYILQAKCGQKVIDRPRGFFWSGRIEHWNSELVVR